MSAWYCESCGSEVIGKIRRGRCESCYRKQLRQLRDNESDAPAGRRRYRQPRRSILTVAERVFQRTTPGWGGCVLFTGHLNSEGYGVVKSAGRSAAAHREIYTQVIGEIPVGMQLDHLCHTVDAECPGGPSCLHRRCVNPQHLEPVTAAENTLRGKGVTASNFFKDQCINGHLYTPANTKLRSSRLRADGAPHRSCRACAIAAAQRKRRAS